MGNTAPTAWDPEQPPHQDPVGPVLTTEAKAFTRKGCSESQPKPDTGDQLLVPSDDGPAYYPHLDIWRCMCIAVVVLDHGNRNYAYWNLFFGQSWALQYIWVICGVCFGLTRKGSGGYLARLFAYLVLGVLINLIANVMKVPHWHDNIWNVVFQFWFVVALIGYSVLLVPMKTYLQRCREVQRALPPVCVDENTRLVSDSWDVSSGGYGHSEQAMDKGSPAAMLNNFDLFKGISVIVAGLVFLYVVLSIMLSHAVNGKFVVEISAIIAQMGHGMEYWADDVETLLPRLCNAVELTLSNVWLAISVPAMLPDRQASTAWLLLINMHSRRLLIWYSGPGEKLLNGFDIMLLGLVCYYLGLKNRRPIGQFLTRYWFVWLAVCGLVWKPGTSGRLDLLMPEEFAYRWRMQVIDAIYMVVWLTAGERFVDPKIFTEDKWKFITYLGLFLFLVHKAIHIVVPEPFNWILILSFGPMFWFSWRTSAKGQAV